MAQLSCAIKLLQQLHNCVSNKLILIYCLHYYYNVSVPASVRCNDVTNYAIGLGQGHPSQLWLPCKVCSHVYATCVT